MTDIWIPESFRDKPYAREHFKAIVEWAVREHPFYRERISAPAEFVPLLDRVSARENNKALLNGHAPQGQTSGSTGFPLDIAWSREKARHDAYINHRFMEMMGGPLPRARIITRYGRDDRGDALEITEPLDKQVEFILKRHKDDDIRALVTYPTNALNLARKAVEEGIDFSFIERLVCFSEAYDDYMTEELKAGFPNARIWTTYSSKELGMIAFLCPHGTGYHHINAGDLGIEILNDQDQPCQPGEMGRIVATDYWNTAGSFIRYDIGDMATPGTCPCGKIQGPALAKIFGKARGALKRENGEPIMFSSIDARLRQLPGLLQYQIIQEELDFLRVRLVSEAEADIPNLEKNIRTELDDFLGFSPRFEFVREDHIGQEPSGKFYATICKV